ncbi:hypothetical protein [Ammoniphilus sp. 3BR4]|uniref:hypothetical protein n=1 Tax=Ammoniphilus sp. 3BR4 TaxID=3158265 RepID=UPI0034655799
MSKAITERMSFHKAIAGVGYQLLRMKRMSTRISAIQPEDKLRLSRRLRNFHLMLQWMKYKVNPNGTSSLVRIRVGKRMLLVNRAVLVRRRTRVNRNNVQQLTMRVRLHRIMRDLGKIRSGLPQFLQTVSSQQKERILQYLTMFHHNFSLVTRKAPSRGLPPSRVKKMTGSIAVEKTVEKKQSLHISEKKRSSRKESHSSNIETHTIKSKKPTLKETAPIRNNKMEEVPKERSKESPKNDQSNILTENKKPKLSGLGKAAKVTKETIAKKKLEKKIVKSDIGKKETEQKQEMQKQEMQKPKLPKEEQKTNPKPAQESQQKAEKKPAVKPAQKSVQESQQKVEKKPATKPALKAPSKPKPFLDEIPYEEPIEKNTEIQEESEAESSYSESIQEFIDAL